MKIPIRFLSCNRFQLTTRDSGDSKKREKHKESNTIKQSIFYQTIVEGGCSTVVEGSGASGAGSDGSSEGYSGVRFQTEQPNDVVARSLRHQTAVQYGKHYLQRPSFLSVHPQ